MKNFQQFRFFNQTYLFKFKIGFTLFCAFFLILFFLLGIWQLHRYHFKQVLLSTYQHESTAEPKPLSQVLATTQFQRVVVKGHYLNQLTMFIQNRFYKNQPGYEVLTPLKIPGEKKLLLINRGWVGEVSEKQLPVIAKVTDEQKITGYIKLANEYQFILGKNILQPNQSPLVMQKVDLEEISQLTHQEFYPFILRLNPTDKNGFVRDWTVATVEPGRHLGYAVQWFLMTLVLFIAYFCFCIERVKSSDSK